MTEDAPISAIAFKSVQKVAVVTPSEVVLDGAEDVAIAEALPFVRTTDASEVFGVDEGTGDVENSEAASVAV